MAKVRVRNSKLVRVQDVNRTGRYRKELRQVSMSSRGTNKVFATDSCIGVGLPPNSVDTLL